MKIQQDAFVGREQELGELTAALDYVMAGHGRLVMLVGEPGIGKTETAEELSAVARSRNTAVIWADRYRSAVNCSPG